MQGNLLQTFVVQRRHRLYNMRMENEFANLIEKEKQAHVVYEGRIISLRNDDIVLPDGREAKREYVCHNGGASVLAIDGEGFVYLVRQFRYPYREVLLEIPAGKLEKGEEAIFTAGRELQEETGFTAGSIAPLGLIYPTPGYTNENLYVFLATDLKTSKMKLDDGEFLNVEKVPFLKLLSDVLDGKIRDGKTCYAVMKYALLKGITL